MKWELRNSKQLRVDGASYSLAREYSKEEIARIAQTRGSVELTNGEHFFFRTSGGGDGKLPKYDFSNWQLGGNNDDEKTASYDPTRLDRQRVKFFLKAKAGSGNLVQGDPIFLEIGDKVFLNNDSEYYCVAVHNENNPNLNNGYIVFAGLKTKNGIIDKLELDAGAIRIVNRSVEPNQLFNLITTANINNNAIVGRNTPSYIFKTRDNKEIALPIYAKY